MVANYIISSESDEQPAGRESVQITEEIAELRSVPVDSSIILKRNLFGTPTEKIDKPSIVRKTPPVKPAQMDTVLMGTILTGEDDYQAIIMTKNDKKQQLVSVGEKVGEYTIINIERGNAILDDNGTEIALDMMEANKYTPRAPAPTAARQARETTEARRVPKKPVRRIVVRPNNQERIGPGELELEQEKKQEADEEEVADSEV